ncbi:E3 ubiquitin-protein ligase RNF187 [Dama dama]|uniref:E3 ubiquitin-protein ligase RNF187 n=2 Tax=Cervinae TaxID=34878 RepID=UPI002A36E513|nr:E3 ubiquitin-protein ligase RNF187 [Dama dama]
MGPFGETAEAAAHLAPAPAVARLYWGADTAGKVPLPSPSLHSTCAYSEPGCPSARSSLCPGSPFTLDPSARPAWSDSAGRRPSPRGASARSRPETGRLATPQLFSGHPRWQEEQLGARGAECDDGLGLEVVSHGSGQGKELTTRTGRLLRGEPRPQARLPLGPAAAALALPAGPGEAACALCQSAPRDPVRADCGHRFCRACVVRFWAEEDGPFPCPECADDCWQRAVEPGRPPLSRRLLALEEAAAAPTRDGPASEAALQLLCRADGGPLCAACRMAAGPEPPEWEPRWRKALRGKENKGSVEIMKKDLNDARDLHGQAESAAAVWKGHVMDRRKKALTDYKKLRAFFAEEEGRFLQEAEKEEGSLEDEDEDPAERFRSLLQAVSELERRHRNLGLSMLLQ